MGEYKESTEKYSLGQQGAAWGVHAFTASGIVAGFWSLVATTEGNFFMAFLMLFIALIIDGIDGTFARIFKVQEVLPNMSGKTMDYVIDFATYAIIPAFIIYKANLIPTELNFLTATIILLTSSIYYGKEGMVSNDMYFVGFPVLWNMVAFCLYYVWGLPPMGNFIAVLAFAVLHFIPIKFLYPSRTKKFMKINVLVTILFILSNVVLLAIVEGGYAMPTELWTAKFLSILTSIYFGGVAVYNTWFDAETKISG